MKDTTIKTSSGITMTERALKHLKKLMEENNISNDYALRVSLKNAGGCGGFTYNLGFDNEEQSGDTIFDNSEIRIIVDGRSLFYLMGAELDYDGESFTFKNPNNAPTCGCG